MNASPILATTRGLASIKSTVSSADVFLVSVKFLALSYLVHLSGSKSARVFCVIIKFSCHNRFSQS